MYMRCTRQNSVCQPCGRWYRSLPTAQLILWHVTEIQVKIWIMVPTVGHRSPVWPMCVLMVTLTCSLTERDRESHTSFGPFYWNSFSWRKWKKSAVTQAVWSVGPSRRESHPVLLLSHIAGQRHLLPATSPVWVFAELSIILFWKLFPPGSTPEFWTPDPLKRTGLGPALVKRRHAIKSDFHPHMPGGTGSALETLQRQARGEAIWGLLTWGQVTALKIKDFFRLKDFSQ